MKQFRLLSVAVVAATIAAGLLTLMTSCSDNGLIGSSIVTNKIEIVVDSTYTIKAQSVESPIIQTRTDNQLLGIINARGYGQLTCDFMSQLMPTQAIDTTGITVANIDSLMLRLYMPESNLIGDSIVPMGLEVYRLNTTLTSPTFSNSTPSNFYDPGAGFLAKSTYSATLLGLSNGAIDTLSKSAIRVVDVKLPLSLAHEFFNKYKEDPTIYSDPRRFSRWFPGIYVKNSFGAGRIMNFSTTSLTLYYHKTMKVNDTDSLYHLASNIMAVTPEVINNNHMTLSVSPELRQRAATQSVIAAPIGYDTKIEFPMSQMISSYLSKPGSINMVNSLILKIPATEISNDYAIAPPPSVLLIKEDFKTKFFETEQSTDNESSFYGTYNSTTKCYEFTDMRLYFLDALAKYQKNLLSPSDERFILTPVSTVTETLIINNQEKTVIVALVPYVGTPVMAVLNTDKAKFTLTFSRKLQ